MSTTTQFAKKGFHLANRCLTPTGAFSCSTSIFFKVSASLRRFNKSLPSWCSCLEQNFRHKILKLRFIHLHAPPYLIFSPQSLLWETFENEASHPRLWREKKTATFIFFWACFSPLYKLYKACYVKGDFFHILKFKVTYSSFRFEVSFNSSAFRRIRSS